MNNKVQQRLIALQDNIANYREEYDFVVQLRSIVNKRLQDLKVYPYSIVHLLLLVNNSCPIHTRTVYIL